LFPTRERKGGGREPLADNGYKSRLECGRPWEHKKGRAGNRNARKAGKGIERTKSGGGGISIVMGGAFLGGEIGREVGRRRRYGEKEAKLGNGAAQPKQASR